MSFKQRVKEPSKTDKLWIHTSKGGKNKCILVTGNSVLPNCVGYAWGRFYEIIGKEPKLSRGNAEDWYGYDDGYKRGKKAKLGAVICWRKGAIHNPKDGFGHVAIVEHIYDDGSLLVSQSGYTNKKRFYRTKIPKDYKLSGYVFQGFIYPPEEQKSKKKKSNTTIAKEVIAGKWGNGNTRKKKLKKAGYNYNAIQSIVNKLLK